MWTGDTTDRMAAVASMSTTRFIQGFLYTDEGHATEEHAVETVLDHKDLHPQLDMFSDEIMMLYKFVWSYLIQTQGGWVIPSPTSH